ncbi:MAG: SpoIID/LytB domain-containing protein, partial [Vicinamibacterales bacterium]
FLVHLLTGASARGIEIQPHLVERARATAAAWRLDVAFDCGNVADRELDGSVVFLYAPCNGELLARVCARIDALAKTGTVDAGGVSQGLVVGVTPSSAPTTGFALLVSGGAGMDAASLVAPRLLAAMQGAGSPAAPAAARAVRTLRVGITQPAGGYAVKEMPLDDYVAGVTAGEAASASAPAALQALAIAARTYALANAGRHGADGFDLCDLTHCQVLRRSTRESSAASRATAGTYLSTGGRVAEVYYTASCGGHTEKPSAVWGGARDEPHLPSRQDEACGDEPAWSSEIAARELLRALRTGGLSGETIRGLSVVSRTDSGRAAWLRVDGLTPSEVSGENLRSLVGRVLGWQHVRSTLFEVTRTSSGYRFAGRGAGHGVGLCVVGAARRARHGADATAILREYYPGLELRTLAASGGTRAVRVVLPVEQEAARREVTELAERSLADVRARLGATAAPAVQLRFHPTVESYQRATGQPWFTAALTRGDVIDLLPVPVLRQRGLLEPTVRHELTHVLTGRALSRAPRWVSEGVAVWAERGAPAAGAAVVCPADAEFEAAASAEALRRVYARAAACYARELQRGRSWTTLGR